MNLFISCLILRSSVPLGLFFFFNDTATTEIYTLSLHDALPICLASAIRATRLPGTWLRRFPCRSEEHTSELQSHSDLVCRLLLEKKKVENGEILKEKKHKNRRKAKITEQKT